MNVRQIHPKSIIIRFLGYIFFIEEYTCFTSDSFFGRNSSFKGRDGTTGYDELPVPLLYEVLYLRLSSSYSQSPPARFPPLMRL